MSNTIDPKEVKDFMKKAQKELLYPPQQEKGMKKLSKMQQAYLDKVLAYQKQNNDLIWKSQYDAQIKSLEQTHYLISRTPEAVKEFIEFVTPLLQGTSNGQEETSGTTDSASKE